MSTREVVDTHRLMYRNARIRALSLSDATTPIQFVNITDESGTPAEIGNIVYTDANGYIFYGANHRRVSCLGIKESAIIQVDLNGNNNWNDIEWIVRKPETSDYVEANSVRKVVDANGNIVWNPLGATDWVFPEYVTPDQLGRGKWAEGEMTVTEATPKKLNVDEWTHTITIMPGHADEYQIEFTAGRIAQAIAIVNNSGENVTITELHEGGSSSESITGNGMIIAVRSVNAKRWLLRSFDTEEYTIGTRKVLRQLLQSGRYNTWIAEADLKMNSYAAIAPDDDGTHDIPPHSVMVTHNNTPLHVMSSDGYAREITNIVYQYEGTGNWSMALRNVPDPSHPLRINVKKDEFPYLNPFGSYAGDNNLYIRFNMCPGERLHVIIGVPETMSFGTSRATAMYVNGCRVLSISTDTWSQIAIAVAGWIECFVDTDNTIYYSFTMDSYVTQQA